MELKNLNVLKNETEKKYHNSFSFSDRRLPQRFKELVTQFDNDRITYNEYSFEVQRSSEGLIVAPNQWLYIAAFYSSYCREMIAYKQELIDHLLKEYSSKKSLEEPIKKCQNNEESAYSLLKKYPEGTNKEYLVKFLSDYSWWGGAKTIDRSDFCASAILSSTRLVNATHGYVAEICEFLAKNPEAESILLTSPEIQKKDTRTEPKLIANDKILSSFVLSAIRYFNTLDELNAIVPFTSSTSPIKVSKKDSFSLTGMFLESTIDDVKERNTDHIRWFEDFFKLGDRNVFLSTQWNSQGNYQLTLADLIKMIQTCYGEKYFYKTGPNGEHQLYYTDNDHRQTTKGTKDIISYLAALRTKPFMLLAGISGTGKSRIVRKLAQATTTQCYADENDRWSDNRPKNFELIQVKPNWHNSMDVVGFYSNISKRYEFTPFIDFIVKAWQDTDTPYFLCLDEMNLAPVEEYFAEFLSAIESRSTDADGKYITDPIIKPFKDFGESDGKEVGKEMLKQLFGEADPIDKNPLAVQFYEKGLTLPPNLMVMGTVNMDETTFTFSRKVLDRAMSIEMNEVDYDKFLSGETDSMPLLFDMNPLLVERPQQAYEVKDNINGDKIVAYLKDVNSLLEGTPFKLGYRAANEAMLYVSACKDFAEEDFDEKKALDEFTLMKILSRIEGDDNRLGLDEDDPRVAAIGVDAVIDSNEQRINLLNCLRAIVRKHIGQDSQTEKKINAMYRTLEREHFVSFWA